MNSDRRQPEAHEGLNVGDIYFVLFRQKWVIVAFCILGVIAAGVVSVVEPALYESRSEVFIQWLTAVANNQSGPDAESQKVSPDARGPEIVQTEMEILTSRDAVDQVVALIGADRILAAYGGGEDTNLAARAVMRNIISADVARTPSTLEVAFQHPDPEVARDVLEAVIEVYKSNSAALHRVEIPEDTNEIPILQRDLDEAQLRLTTVKKAAGVIYSMDDTKKDLSFQRQQIMSDIRKAEVDLASIGMAAPLKSSTNNAVGTAATTNAPQEIPDEVTREYQLLLKDLNAAESKLADAQLNDMPGNQELIACQTRVDNVSAALKGIRQKYPDIDSSPVPASATAATGQTAESPDPAVTVRELVNRTNALHSQLAAIDADEEKLESSEQEIRQLEEAVTFKSDLLKRYEDRANYAVTSSHSDVSGGIKIMEHPTPAVRTRSKAAKKMMYGALAVCVLAGFGLAFAIEMVLDPTVKRPSEIEKKLRLPLFISIPDVNGRSHSRVAALPDKNRPLLNETNSTALVSAKGNGNGTGPATGKSADDIAVWDPEHKLHRFYGGLRDRLIVNFEVRNLNHNPKLVGVTSCNRGAGVSTVAAGLAASLSETGDGNVLLVDMRGNGGSARQFYKGKPACGVEAALGTNTRSDAQINEHLYAAEEAPGNDLPAGLSKRFATLVPKLRASDFDYIVFDMPPVSQTSITARLSGLMDMVLLVIESEKSNRDSVKRATALLKESKAHVSTVLNKVHTYVPARLHQEFLDDEA